MRKARWCVLLSLAAAASTGCSGLHLHHAGDFDTAKKAEEAFEEADLKGSIGTERERLAEMLENELAVVRRHLRAQRDGELMPMLLAEDVAVDATLFWPSVLTGKIDARVSTLTSLDPAEVLKKDIEVREGEKALAADASTYRLAGPGPDDPKARCPLPQGSASASFSSPAVQAVFQTYAQTCTKLLGHKQNRANLLTSGAGEISDVVADIDAIEQQASTAKDQLKTLSGAYKTAKKEYDQAIEDSASDLADKAEKLKEEYKEWLEEAEKVGAAQPLHLEGLIAALKEAEGEVDRVLDAVIAAAESDDETLTAESSDSLRTLALLAAAGADVHSDLAKPNVSGLLLEAENLRLEREWHKRRLANARARLGFKKANYAALIAELALLQQARFATSLFVQDCSPADRPLLDHFRASNPGCRTHLAQSLLAYAGSWDTGRLVQEEIEYRLIAAHHDAALDSSEIALARWQNLIGVPLSQLVAYHGGGITPRDVGNLVNALGLTAIAAD